MKPLERSFAFRSPALLALALLLNSTRPVAAVVPPVVVFDSFGPGNTYKNTVVWGVSGPLTSNGFRGQAEWFVPGITGNLDSMTLATYRASGSGRSNFFIAEDTGYGIPGDILERYTFVANNPNGLLTLTSVRKPLLEAGVKYWLCDEPADSTTINGWYQNNQNYAPGFAYERSSWSWTSQPPEYSPDSGVFRVTVTPVPEPSTLCLIPLGATVFAWRRWRRKA